MRAIIFVASLAIFFHSCDWHPEEITVERAAVVKHLNIAIGDTVSLTIQPEGSDFSEILNPDTSIIEIINNMNYDLGGQLFLIGKNTGVLDLSFSYNVLVAPDSPPATATYFIHLNVTESIPIHLNIGEVDTLDFSPDLSTEQLFELDSIVVVAVQQISGGAISVENISGEQTKLILTGEIPGSTELIIEAYDINGNQFAALFYQIDISIHKVVMAELFTNTGCINCPQANEYLDNISNLFQDEFVLARYYVNWTDPFDPMNLYNPTAVETRRAYYNIFAAPGLVLDGTLVSSLDEDDWSSRVFNASQEVPPIYISSVDVLESVDSLHVEFDLNTFGIVLSDLTVWSLVFEDSIEYTGSNGETLHMGVMRDMASSSLNSLNTLRVIQHSLKKPEGYDETGHISVLVFVQSEVDKAVLQARKQILN